MWNLGIGIVELIVLISVYLLLTIFAGSRHLWTWSLLPSLAVGAVLSPADLLSMLVIAIPLTAMAYFGFYFFSLKNENQLIE